ncbi:MAG: hypothetical protein WBZ29_13000, partial [Methanocella sp.]
GVAPRLERGAIDGCHDACLHEASTGVAPRLILGLLVIEHHIFLLEASTDMLHRCCRIVIVDFYNPAIK